MSTKEHQTSGDDDPSMLPYELIKHITNNFDKERILGSGECGTTYKGIYENGEEIAVKVLLDMSGLGDRQFENELQHLRKLKHQNLVEFVAFCNESQGVFVHHNGKQVFAEQMNRVLCYEYVPNGSLTNHVSDANSGLDWHTRYRIIKGTCEGLKYLHEGLEKPIFHLNLNLDNILLDNDMQPKISDFGLLRLLDGARIRASMSHMSKL